MPLSDTKIRNAKPKEKPYKLMDGQGLFIHIKPSGNKIWYMRYYFLGKEKSISLGPYPILTLAEARVKRDETKKQLLQGINPTQHRRSNRLKMMEASENTFEAVARRWMSIKNISSDHQARTVRRLEIHAFSRIGPRPLDELTTLEIANCLEAIAKEGKAETANRIKQIIQQVFRYGVRRGLIDNNPAGDLRDIIRRKPVENRACIPPEELPALVRDMNAYSGRPLTIAAMKLLALTFVRTGELIGARWDEINWDRNEWVIPAERMKMRHEHIVPLSTQAVKILKDVQKETGRRELIFYSASNKGKHISNNAVLGALKRMGYNGRMTGHGFRALASTILNEQRKYHPDVIEKQLAHADRNEIRAIYNRANYLLERKAMMQDWADFLDKTLISGDVIIGNFRKTG